MTPIDQHLYDESRVDTSRADQAAKGVATPPQPATDHRTTEGDATGLNVAKMKQILQEQGRYVADAIDPLQKTLDLKLQELDNTLRPKLQQPVKEKPLLAVAVSAGAGAVIGALGILLLVARGQTKR